MRLPPVVMRGVPIGNGACRSAARFLYRLAGDFRFKIRLAFRFSCLALDDGFKYWATTFYGARRCVVDADDARARRRI